ncbi:spermidine synthase [Singulisphaera sp. GP187]|uniref:spermine/spermidine synthase domain-containing protein n=1 Tax=Singulisphaera sp. GP187 TaxID=1882752 RepID=UPI00092805CF|nr:SAM-dependent methyltransferase [Singulisphaera sp. GP187]SIO60617.1 spermidine synthase [Singulisphaera sp. GP187]
MNPHDPILPTAPAAPRRFLPMLLVLFVGSGCAALIYEIVWLQLLQLVIGSTAVSLAVLLGTFMGGMCLGSLLLPRVVSVRRHPLRVYALLELGIGAIGLVVLFGMPYVEQVYSHYAGHGAPGIWLRGAVAAVCLLPPTLLMGATLPAIARWVETDAEGVSWLGFFYGGNLAGAVFGCLLAGFYLLRVHDMATATYVAFALNLAVAAIALALAASLARHEVPAGPTTNENARPAAGAWAVYLAIALSGMSALGAEVVWTRLLSLMLGGTVYTFSLILAVFLIGLGIGSTLGAILTRGAVSSRVALGICQWFLTAAIAWTAVMISQSLPYWPIVPGLSPSPWYIFQLDLVRCLWAILPPACLWGASFPLALAAVAARGQDPGRLVGGVYAANTIGAIAGALVFSLLLVPTIGTAGAERVLIGLALTAALVALLPLVRRSSGTLRLGGATTLAAAVGVAGCLAWSVTPVPWELVAFGRATPSLLAQSAPGIVKDVPEDPGDADVFCTYVGEGTNVSVAVTMTADGVRSFHGAGKIQASTLAADMRLQRMLGHLPALVHKKPESVLVVACGAGITAGTFVLHPDVKRVVICDIEPLVPTIVTPMFGVENYHVVDGIARENPHTVNGKQVKVVYDDGRHFLRTTPEKFDIITSDPIDPWVKGCAALNTVEYYQMCRDHLNPGGIVCLWIPLYESNLATSKSVIATFFQVFPNGILWSNEHKAFGSDAVWSNERDGFGYDAVLFGQIEPTVIDVDELQGRLDRPDHKLVKQSLREVGFGEFNQEGTDLLTTYSGEAPLLKEWSRGAQINTDRNLRLQYLAGMWLNSNMGEKILSGILAYYQFPAQLFVGSPESVQTLRQALTRAGRKSSPELARDRAGLSR